MNLKKSAQESTMPPLNPLLESDTIECAHKGKVLLQSSTKDLLCVQDSSGNDAGMISLSDLANASIIGCANNIAGVPSPCTKLVSIPNSICSTLLEIDNQKIVLAQAISQVLTDKGSPIILQGEPKAKDIFEIDEDIVENVQNGNDSAESSEDSNESNAESNAKTSTDSSKNSQSTQDSQKEIIEMYFSYGKECKNIKTDSKIESDVNLHIITQGYNKGESLTITLESDDGRIINASGNVGENGEVVIYNVLTENKE